MVSYRYNIKLGNGGKLMLDKNGDGKISKSEIVSFVLGGLFTTLFNNSEIILDAIISLIGG